MIARQLFATENHPPEELYQEQRLGCQETRPGLSVPRKAQRSRPLLRSCTKPPSWSGVESWGEEGRLDLIYLLHFPPPPPLLPRTQLQGWAHLFLPIASCCERIKSPIGGYNEQFNRVAVNWDIAAELSLHFQASITGADWMLPAQAMSPAGRLCRGWQMGQERRRESHSKT